MRRWVPSFLLGMATAVVAELGLGLLLFVSPGLLPALTVVLTVALGSLGLGLASARSRRGRPLAAGWRWLLAVVSLVAAALLSLGWSFQGGAPATDLGRGINLAVLVALPLYSLGACLSAVGQADLTARPAASAALGGAVGVVLLGVALLPRVEPMSVYFFCLLCVAVAAMTLSSAENAPRDPTPLGPGGDPWALDPVDR
jgi:hypothetical protein